jgi:pathogenesis-related protein 1
MIRYGLFVPLLFWLGCSSADATGDDASKAGTGGAGATSSGGSESGGSESGETGGTEASGAATGAAGRNGSSGSGQAGAADEAGKGGSGGGASPSGGAAGAAGSAELVSHTNPLSQDLINAFVAAHNAARASPALNPTPSPALPPVSWDPILADSAYNYLSKCVTAAGGALVDHNADRTSDYQALGGTDSYVGENIYGTTGNTVAPADAVNAWMSEASAFTYAKPNFSVAGHYSQVVWRASVRIGCAIVNCPNARDNNTVLCDYAPGGNITGQKPY